MVQVPCKGEIGSPATVTVHPGGVWMRVGGMATQVPAADAEKALEPVHALSDHRGLSRLRIALHGDDRGAKGVVSRDEVPAGAGADQRRAGDGGRGLDAVADMG
jgi:hypothetical protein